MSQEKSPNKRQEIALPHSLNPEAEQVLDFFRQFYNDQREVLRETYKQQQRLFALYIDEGNPEVRTALWFGNGKLLQQQQDLEELRSAIDMAAVSVGGRPVSPNAEPGSPVQDIFEFGEQ